LSNRVSLYKLFKPKKLVNLVKKSPTWLSGRIILVVMSPLILGSLWAYIHTIFVIALTVLRTSLEDKTLQAELPGYVDYVQKTHFRVLPGNW